VVCAAPAAGVEPTAEPGGRAGATAPPKISENF